MIAPSGRPDRHQGAPEVKDALQALYEQRRSEEVRP
jgi:hypothetical protein